MLFLMHLSRHWGWLLNLTLKPYKIGWIKRGTETKVIELCWVPFSTGKHYMDIAICDVVGMDACYILLGWPWQFNVKVVDHYRDNTYMFPWKVKKILLNPMLELKPIVNTRGLKKVVVIVNGPQFVREIQCSKYALILVAKELFEHGIKNPSLL